MEKYDGVVTLTWTLLLCILKHWKLFESIEMLFDRSSDCGGGLWKDFQNLFPAYSKFVANVVQPNIFHFTDSV